MDWASDGETMRSTLVVTAPGDSQDEPHHANVVEVEQLYAPGGARYGLPNPDHSYTPRQYEMLVRMYTTHDHFGRIVSWTSRSAPAVRGELQ